MRATTATTSEIWRRSCRMTSGWPPRCRKPTPMARSDDGRRAGSGKGSRRAWPGWAFASMSGRARRGFDHLIYVWGADHHGTVARVRNAALAMGYDQDAVQVLLYSWVRFARDG